MACMSADTGAVMYGLERERHMFPLSFLVFLRVQFGSWTA